MICPVCRDRFTKSVGWQEYCSKKCGNVARVRKHRKGASRKPPKVK